MYRTILVPLDGSTRAERILPHVEALAATFHARVVLLQVTNTEAAMRVPPEMQYTQESSGMLNVPVDTAPAENAHAYLMSKQAGLQAKRIEVDIRIEKGPVVATIIAAAESENADLIAIASHGRTGLRQVFYGSVASGVLHRIDRPLLIIRAEDGD